MKILSDAGGFQKLAKSGMRVAGSILLDGVAAGLVAAWALTGSLCELGSWMMSSDKSSQRNK
jgi:hypothetical protein